MEISNIIKNLLLNQNNKVEGQSKYLSLWNSYYQGDQVSLNYKIYNGKNEIRRKKKSLHFANKVCEDMANFILNEKCDFAIEEKQKEVLIDYLNKIDFWSNANKTFKDAMALSLGAFVNGIDNAVFNEDGKLIKKGTLKTQFVDAFNIYPITIINKKIVECAFVNCNTNYSEIELHLLDENKNYVIRQAKIDDSGNLIGEVATLNTLSPIPWYQLLFPNTTNNLDLKDKKPISFFANILDIIDSIDSKYDGFSNEFEAAKRRIFVDSSLWRVDTTPDDGNIIKTFDENDTVFYSIPNASTGERPSIQTDAAPIRDNSYISGIEADLNLACLNLGLGKSFYNFVGGAGRPLQTATAVISMNSDLIRCIRKHEIVVKEALTNFIKSIQYISNTFTNTPIGDFDFNYDNVITDDSIFEDKETEMQRDRTNVASGLMSEVEFRMRWFNETKEDAENFVYEHLRYKILNNYIQALISNAISPSEFVNICYKDKKDDKKQELVFYITEKLSKNEITVDALGNIED